jgi:hypothetical protein
VTSTRQFCIEMVYEWIWIWIWIWIWRFNGCICTRENVGNLLHDVPFPIPYPFLTSALPRHPPQRLDGNLWSSPCVVHSPILLNLGLSNLPCAVESLKIIRFDTRSLDETNVRLDKQSHVSKHWNCLSMCISE